MTKRTAEAQRTQVENGTGPKSKEIDSREIDSRAAICRRLW